MKYMKFQQMSMMTALVAGFFSTPCVLSNAMESASDSTQNPATISSKTVPPSKPPVAWQGTIVDENSKPDWVQISSEGKDTVVAQNVQNGQGTKNNGTLYINRNSVEKNPGNPNWINMIVLENINLQPAQENATDTKKPVSSTIMRYTVDCAHNIVLPIDYYAFDAPNAMGELVSEGVLPQGAVKLDENSDAVYQSIKTQACSLPASDPLAMMPSDKPEWLLIHRPQPPQADPSFIYVDENSIRTSIENPQWRRVAMLIQLEPVAGAEDKVPQVEPEVQGSQVWQISVDCSRQLLRADIATGMEKAEAQGRRGRAVLYDKVFDVPADAQGKRLVEVVCKKDLGKQK